MNHNTLEDFLVILGNNNLWKKYEKEEIIQARIQLCMSKRQKKKANGWQCCGYESDEKSTEGSGRDSNSGLDSVDDPVNDLDNTHHDEKRLTAVEMKRVRVRQMKIFQIMKE